MKICSSTLNFCQCGQVVHPRFEKMNGLRKVQKKGLKVGMFLTRNERLICGRLKGTIDYAIFQTSISVKFSLFLFFCVLFDLGVKIKSGPLLAFTVRPA